MRISYITSQMKQFLLSSFLMCVIAVGISVSNTFDTNYLIQADAKTANKVIHSKIALNKKVDMKKSLIQKSKTISPTVYNLLN
jgi:hypothetical protein